MWAGTLRRGRAYPGSGPQTSAQASHGPGRKPGLKKGVPRARLTCRECTSPALILLNTACPRQGVDSALFLPFCHPPGVSTQLSPGVGTWGTLGTARGPLHSAPRRRRQGGEGPPASWGLRRAWISVQSAAHGLGWLALRAGRGCWQAAPAWARHPQRAPPPFSAPADAEPQPRASPGPTRGLTARGAALRLRADELARRRCGEQPAAR